MVTVPQPGNPAFATEGPFASDPQKGYMEEANSATNRQAFRLMLLRWTTWLHENLAKVRAEQAE